VFFNDFVGRLIIVHFFVAHFIAHGIIGNQLVVGVLKEIVAHFFARFLHACARSLRILFTFHFCFFLSYRSMRYLHFKGICCSFCLLNLLLIIN